MPGLRELAETAPTGGAILATSPPHAQARERSAGPPKTVKIALEGDRHLDLGELRPDPVPDFHGKRGYAPDQMVGGQFQCGIIGAGKKS